MLTHQRRRCWKKGLKNFRIESLESRALLTVAFNTPIVIPSLLNPTAAASADFDQDGDVDLAVLSGDFNRITIFTQEAGQFLRFTEFPAGGAGPGYDLAAGDVNGDTLPDLISVGSTVRILHNFGGGAFGQEAELLPLTGTDPRHLLLSDLDGDGQLDIAISNRIHPTVDVFLGQSGTFIPTLSNIFVGGGAIKSGDFNQDLLPDLVVVSTQLISLYLGVGAGQFSFYSVDPTSRIDPTFGRTALAVGDLNSDGWLDYAATDEVSSTLILGQNLGGFIQSQIFLTEASPMGVAISDFDADGTSEIAVMGQRSMVLSILAPTVFGGYQSVLNLQTFPYRPTAMLDCDLDSNGTTDLVSLSQGGFAMHIFINSFTPSAVPVISIQDVRLNEGNNGTTRFDFLLTRTGDTRTASEVYWSTSDGVATSTVDYAGASSTRLEFAPDQTEQTISVYVVGDFDVEGDEDFYVNLTSPSNATLARNLARGTILNDDHAPNAQDDYASTGPSTAVVINVLNNDSDPDRDAVTIDSVATPTNGAATIVNGQIRYTPNALFHGTDSFLYKITDGHGGYASAQINVFVGNGAIVIRDPNNSQKTILDFAGGPGNDVLTLLHAGAQGKVNAYLGGAFQGTFLFTGDFHIDGLEGNDTINVDSKITRNGRYLGGAGNDVVQAGGGHDLVFGGSGNDALFGNGGRDILVGGADADNLDGGADDDLLIGGITAHGELVSPWIAIQSEWTRTDLPTSKSYAQRVDHLTRGGGKNGATLLDARNVFSQVGIADVLRGAKDRDLFYRGRIDSVLDLASNETTLVINESFFK